jgi:uncharacterized protein YabN with tetrapyrrole methylase and pyrophosphatase domain
LANVDFRQSLENATDKFIRRYKHIEKKVSETGKAMNELELDDLEFYWIDAKEEGF